MKTSRLISKLKSFFTIFIAPPKRWQLPKRAEVLIYDASGTEALAPYLTKYSVATLEVRGESINVPCLLRAALTLSFWKVWKYNSFAAYAEAFIHAVSPKVVITFIDNNSAFYKISKRFSGVTTVFIQNGTRGESGDVFDGLVKSDKYHVDYMLVHGRAIGSHYLNYISGQFIPIGSLKNNAVTNINSVDSEGVLFISQWHSRPEGGGAFYVEHDGTAVYWDKFFTSEVVVLKFLDRWCAANNKKLKICGRTKGKEGPEQAFYADFLTECVWEYISKMDNYSSYELINTAEIVVSIDSTLGYESIIRGKKTAALSCRGSSIESDASNFGWPANLPNNGPFWTNDQNEAQFQRIMDYLVTVSNDDWTSTSRSFSTELMEFDLGNRRFVALLDQIFPKSESQSC
jgi:surface carbohydrate biosynthesis protein